MTRTRGPLFYSTVLAGGLSLAGLTADGYAKTLDPLHQDDFGGFVSRMTGTSTASSAFVPSTVQNTIIGEDIELDEAAPQGSRGLSLSGRVGFRLNR